MNNVQKKGHSEKEGDVERKFEVWPCQKPSSKFELFVKGSNRAHVNEDRYRNARGDAQCET